MIGINPYICSMYKIIQVLLVISILSSSCSNDLNLNADWRPIPVVYGFLDIQASNQYIRVQKVFLDPNTNALLTAQNIDSLFFEGISVLITRVSNGKSWSFTRVDGNLEGFQKPTGVFANAPNWVYKLPSVGVELKENESYKLSIVEEITGKVVAESTTKMVGSYTFIQSEPSNPFPIPYLNKIRVSWKSSEKVARLYSVSMLINYSENSLAKPNVFTAKTLEWKFDDKITRPQDLDSRVSGFFKGDDFFKFLGATIPAANGIKRSLTTVGFKVYAGGEEFVDYFALLDASSGITSSQIVPNYSNIKNGVGIFSSRSLLQQGDFSLNTSTRDSLSEGIYTSKLGFQ